MNKLKKCMWVGSVSCAGLVLALIILQFLPFWQMANGKTVSIAQYVWFPAKNSQVMSIFRTVNMTDINEIILTPVLFFFVGIVAIVFGIWKRNNNAVPLLGLVCGVIAVVQYMLVPVYQISNLSIVALVLSCVLAIVAFVFSIPVIIDAIVTIVNGIISAVLALVNDFKRTDRPENIKSGSRSLVSFVILWLLFGFIYYSVWIYKTTYFLNITGKEYRTPIKKMLLCWFVPFYSIYWMYKTAELTETLAFQKKVQSDIKALVLILSIFLGIFIPAIIIQHKINAIATKEHYKQYYGDND